MDASLAGFRFPEMRDVYVEEWARDVEDPLMEETSPPLISNNIIKV